MNMTWEGEKLISRHMGCWLLPIESVLCGSDSILRVRFFGTPCMQKNDGIPYLQSGDECVHVKKLQIKQKKKFPSSTAEQREREIDCLGWQQWRSTTHPMETQGAQKKFTSNHVMMKLRLSEVSSPIIMSCNILCNQQNGAGPTKHSLDYRLLYDSGHISSWQHHGSLDCLW